MATDDDSDVPETGAIFTFGKSQFAENIPNKFWIRDDRVTDVCCGDEHTALVAGSGRVFTFGVNEWGQLGLGHNKIVKKPTRIKALKTEKVTHVTCGRSHTLLSTESGKLYSFGANGEGQLGLGNTSHISQPTQVEGIAIQQFSKLVAGADHSLILTDDGDVFVWGSNSEGQLGLGDEQEAWQPIQLKIDEKVISVACGYYHTAMVTERGDLYTFGETEDGKLGLGHDPEEHKTPQKVHGIQGKAVHVACGGKHTVVITDAGKLYTFGEGSNGQLGHGTTLLSCDKPTLVKFSKKGIKVKQASCGENHTAVITEKGQLYAFGDGRHGKLALGEENFANQFKPTLVERFTGFTADDVSCGGCHTLVIAKLRVQNGDVSSSEDEFESSEDEDFTIKTDMNGTVRTSMDLNGSISARNRRREKLADPGDTINRTLPPLDSSLSVGRPLEPLSSTLPALGSRRLDRGKLPALGLGLGPAIPTASPAKEESDESGVSVSENSDYENQKPMIKVTSEHTTKSALPQVKPRPTPRKADQQSGPVPASRLQSRRPPSVGAESSDEKEKMAHRKYDSSQDSGSEEDKKKKNKKVSKKDKKINKNKNLFGRRKMLESDSEDDDREQKKHVQAKESSPDDSDNELPRLPKKTMKAKKVKDKNKKKKVKRDDNEDESDRSDQEKKETDSEAEKLEKISKKKAKEPKKKRLQKKKKMEMEKSENEESEESEKEMIPKKKVKEVKQKPKKKKTYDSESESESDKKKGKKKGKAKEESEESKSEEDERKGARKSDDEDKQKDVKTEVPKPQEKKKSRTCTVL